MVAKIKKYPNKQSNAGRTILKIFGWILLVAIISFGALTGLKIYRDSNTVKDADVQDINTADVNNESVKSAEPNSDKKTTQGNDAKAKTDELEKQQAKEVPKNENGLKIANVVLNEPYFVEENKKVVISSTITNVVETEGNCSYIFTNESLSMTKKTKVLPNAKNTVCEAVVLDKANLKAGKWKVRLEYKSNYSEGVSETQTFTIQ